VPRHAASFGDPASFALRKVYVGVVLKAEDTDDMVRCYGLLRAPSFKDGKVSGSINLVLKARQTHCWIFIGYGYNRQTSEICYCRPNVEDVFPNKVFRPGKIVSKSLNIAC